MFTLKKIVLKIYIQQNFLQFKEIFSLTVYKRNVSFLQGNKFVYIKENFFESTKISSIQRNLFFGRITKKCFFDSKKLFSGCDSLNFVFIRLRKKCY